MAGPETLAERDVADAVAHERVAEALAPGEADVGGDAVAEMVPDAEKLVTTVVLLHADEEGDEDPDFVTVGETDDDGECDEERDVDVEPVAVLESSGDREALVEGVDLPDADDDAVSHAEKELEGVMLGLREGDTDADVVRELFRDCVDTDDADDEAVSEGDAVCDGDADDDAVTTSESVAAAVEVPVVELEAEFDSVLEFVRDSRLVTVGHAEGVADAVGKRVTELERERTERNDPATKFVTLGANDADDESDGAAVALGESDGEEVAELDAVCDGDGDDDLLAVTDGVTVCVTLGDMLAVRLTDAVVVAVATARTVARVDEVGLVEVEAEREPPETVAGAVADLDAMALRDAETVTETEELARAERDSDVDPDELRDGEGLAVPVPETLDDREPLGVTELVLDPDVLGVVEAASPCVVLPLALRVAEFDARGDRDAKAHAVALLLPVVLAETPALSE